MQKCPIPIFKTVQFQFLLFSKQSQIFQNCILVLFFRFSPQVPRKLSSPRVRRSLAQIHTWQAINSTQCQNSAESRHINTNRFRFLSPFSYGSKSQNPQEAQEHTNPRLFQNQDSTKFNGVCIDSQRFSIESSSLNRFFCNSNASSPPKGSKLKRDHRGVRREEEGRKNLRIQNQ